MNRITQVLGTSLLLGASLCAWEAQAISLDPPANLVYNGSFEDLESTFIGDGRLNMSLLPGSMILPGWTVFGAELGWVGMGPGDWGVDAKDGNKLVDFTGYHNDGNYAGVTQDILTDIGTVYEVVFHIGRGGNGDANYAGPNSVRATAGDLFGVHHDEVFTSAGGTSDPTTWERFSFRFTAQDMVTTISFQGAGKGGCCLVGLDDVAVTAVPEPGTYALIATGALMVGWQLRRRPRQNSRMI